MRRTHHPQALYRLIYCSQRVAPAETGRAWEPFAEAARVRTEAMQITGALLCTEDNYASVLEGTRDALEHVFEQIARDRRHSEVTVLSLTPTERRRFPAHALLTIDAGTEAYRDVFAGLRPDPARDRPRLTTGCDILRLLERLARAKDGVPA